MARQWHRTVLMASALMPLAAASTLAGPNNYNVVNGNVTVQGPGTANVVINQTSQSAIINWQSFNIGVGESTKIIMPGATSTELDRVTGQASPSQIFGSLSSNGRVFLVNPNGILFGPSAQINVGSLLATTHDIKNSDFMAGRYNFNGAGNPSASVVNQGTITAQTGGFAALVAPGVRNTGTITAKLGTISLASGNMFTLDMYGDNLITLGINDSISSQVIDVATGKPLKSLVSNKGKLEANGGTVVLTAVAARKIVDSVINNSGVIEANTIGSHKGMIVLGAATGVSNQKVKVSGRLSVAGKRNGTSGGTVQVTGENIAIVHATIDASGQAGGGTVLIGGDWGGGHPNASLVSDNASATLQPYAMPDSSTVSIDAATKIDASATDNGNGGKVIVWANQATTFLGTIMAKGGAQSGNGGFVETSGGALTYSGTVNTAAASGKVGTWLLDPTDLTIDAAGAATIASGLANNNVIVYTDADGGTSGQGSTARGPGNIIVGAPITWLSGNALTIDAYNSIEINAAISGANGGLILNANNAISASAAVTMGSFTLQNGAWSQIGTLPVFSANNFTIGGGSFLRASGGNGSTGSPYQIVDVYGLQGMGSGATLLASDYVLNNSIDASGTASWNSGAGFVPIGNSTTAFTGSLNGNGKTINGLTISSSAQFVGLFGLLEGTVNNLGVTNVSVTAGVTPYGSVGALAGQNNGQISNSYATGSVTGSTSSVGGSTSSVAGSTSSVAERDEPTGGLVGTNNGSVNNSYATGSVSGADTGGLIGDNFGTVTSSYAVSTVTGDDGGYRGSGGLVGNNYGSISGSSAGGSVTGTFGRVGGLVGFNELGSISNSYSTASVNGLGTSEASVFFAGGLVGENDGSITNAYSTGSVTASPSYATGGFVGGNDSGGTISSAYSIGVVSSAKNTSGLGGLIGVNNGGIISSAYWDTQASGQGASAGGLGLTTAQFRAGLPSGFDPTVWGSNLNVNNGYPYFLSSVAGPIQIITIDALPETKIYGNSDPVLAYDVVAGDLGSLTLSGSLTRETGENVGSYAIDEGTLTAPPGYEIAFVDSTLTITPRPIVVTANSQSVTYGSLLPQLTYAIGGLGLVNGDTLTGSLATTATTMSDVGSYGITQSTLKASHNYQVTFQPGVLTINPAPLTITADNQSKMYGTILDLGNAAFTITGPLYNGDKVNSVFLTSVGAAPTASVAGGPYAIVASGAKGIGLNNYDISYAKGALSVQPGQLFYVASPENRIYGAANPALTGTVTGFVNGDTLASATIGTLYFSTAATSTSTIGSYAIDGSGLAALGGNYLFLQAPGNATALTINPATATSPTPPPPTPPSFPPLNNPPNVPSNKSQQVTVAQGSVYPVQQTTRLTSTVSYVPSAGPLFALPPFNTLTGRATIGQSSIVGDSGNGIGSLANGKEGGNGAPPGVRLIDMRVMPLPPGSGVPPTGETRFLSNQVVAQFGADITPQQIAAIAQRFNLTILEQRSIDVFGRAIYTFEINNGRSVPDVIRAIESAGLNVAAQPNYTYRLLQDQTEPHASVGDRAQYIIDKLHLGAVHQITDGNHVIVALIDSRVDRKQPDFAGSVVDDYNAGCGSDAPPDPHGTGMVGAIASHVSLLGIAPSANIMAICAFTGSEGSPESTSAKIIRGLDYAIEHGAQVVNMSFAGAHDPALAQELQIAREKGILMVAAAGNAGPKSPPLYPGADPNVMAVTATDERDRLFPGANQGNYVTVAAPGVNILVPAPNDSVQFTTGTSVATANVSGVTALLIAQKPSITPEKIRALLVSTAKHLGPKGINIQYGAGLVDPLRALKTLSGEGRDRESSTAPLR